MFRCRPWPWICFSVGAYGFSFLRNRFWGGDGQKPTSEDLSSKSRCTHPCRHVARAPPILEKIGPEKHSARCVCCLACHTVRKGLDNIGPGSRYILKMVYSTYARCVSIYCEVRKERAVTYRYRRPARYQNRAVDAFCGRCAPASVSFYWAPLNISPKNADSR